MHIISINSSAYISKLCPNAGSGKTPDLWHASRGHGGAEGQGEMSFPKWGERSHRKASLTVLLEAT